MHNRVILPLILSIVLSITGCTARSEAAPTRKAIPPEHASSPGAGLSTASPTPNIPPLARETPSEDTHSAGTQPPVAPSTEPAPSATPTLTQPIISPANAHTLQPAGKYSFQPWELALALAWSPDSSTLAVAAGEQIFIYTDGADEPTSTLVPGVWSTALAISASGRLLAAGGRDGVLRVWELASRKLRLTIQAHPKGINVVAFDPFGQIIATGGNDALAQLWDSATGESLGSYIGGTYSVPTLAFSPDGDQLAIANGNTIRLRDVETQRFVYTIVGQNPFYTLAIHPEGRLLATGDTANTVQLWDLPPDGSSTTRTNASRLTLHGHSGRAATAAALIWEVAFNTQGNLLASAAGDHTTRIWDPQSGEMLAVLEGHERAVTSLAFRPDGRLLATGSLDGTVILWAAQP